MKQKEYETKLRRLTFVVLGFIAWAIVTLTFAYVITMSGVFYGYRILTDSMVFVILVLGLYFVLTRIKALVFDTANEEIQEL